VSEDVPVKRTITGSAAARSMTLGELRQFVTSLEGLPDDALVKSRATWRRHLRALTVEEEDVGFSSYVLAVADPDAEAADAPDRGRASDRATKTKVSERSSAS
jgi:hypothetical protein